MKLLRIILAAVAVALLAMLLFFSAASGSDPRIEPFIGFEKYGFPIREAAIEREVAEAELAEYGDEIVPALRSELNRGSWWRSKTARWAASWLPQQVGKAISKREAEQESRAEKAALTLGRLRERARSAVPDLRRAAVSGRVRGANVAGVALAMIQQNDPVVQTNAIAALAQQYQPRRVQFARRAFEIWPDRPELLAGLLRDADDTVRAGALYALRFYGPRASSSVPVLLEMLSDPSPVVRPCAALALGCVSPEHGAVAVAAMLEQQRTNNSWTGDQAYVLFQTVGPAASAAIPTLAADLADSRKLWVHGDAAGALWRITSNATPEVVEGLATGVRIGVQCTQLRCLAVLREIGPPASSAIPALNQYTNHHLILIRKMAREALESVDIDRTNKK